MLLALVMSIPGQAYRNGSSQFPESGGDEKRSFDARVARTSLADVAPTDRQRIGIEALRQDVPDLDVSFDPRTGATKGLWNRAGYLSDPDGRSTMEIADSYIARSLDSLGLLPTDVADREVTDVVYSKVTGATHIYYRQRLFGIPVYHAQLHVNISRDGRILSVNNSFLPDLAGAFNFLQPTLDATEAAGRAADHLGVTGARLAVRSTGATVQRATELLAENLSTEPIRASLMWLPVGKGDARLVWNFQVDTLDGEHAYDFTVDADSGSVWTRLDWVASDQYKVYPRPVESPNHTSLVPPADGRTTVINPAHAVASLFGWHDTNGVAGAEYTIMRGNNVHAYEDSNSNNAPPVTQPDCGASLNCTFALDLAAAPSAYRDAAVANMFYWNNIIHDVQYQYGFDEAAGNFQVNNYARGGAGNDDVRAEAQDGGGTNNANFSTPPDGSRPRMQMYVWTAPTPDLDGDFDHGIVVHEYGHGISNRLVGGPSTTSCLGNSQQPGEGLSDWWALVYTATAAQTGPEARGVGTYALGQATTGTGIRSLPYSTNTAVNNWTYASIAGKAVPHGVGAVWAQGMWRVYWALVDQHGFSTDLYDGTGTAGNQRAMLYVNEGLKNTSCNPAFTDVRDGIIQAAVDSHSGEDVCRIWTAFAAFGLGVDAVSGGSGSTTPTNGFNVPQSCGGPAPVSLSINDASVTEGDSGTTTATFTATLSAASAGSVSVDYATSDGTATSGGFSSSGAIAVPGVGTSGTATPYPSPISVTGATGTIQSLTVRLNSMSHTYPKDLDIVIVGPGGQKVMLMSDAGGGADISGVTLSFEDGATALTTGQIVAGTYAPTDFSPGETLPNPAPAGPYGTALSVFNGTDPNGTWNLYVNDDEGFDSGSIAGWSVVANTGAQDFVSKSGFVTFAPGTTSAQIAITINGDTTAESNETFTVNLSNPTGAVIADGQGVGTIIDQDSVPGAPTSVSGTPGNGQVSVSFGAPSSTGGSAVTGYTVMASPGGATASGSSSPLVVTG
ncbi:MAG: hypothetical protein HQ485_03150, partial [Acidobacteria bacterium]|nr:hypothetical protein [Acidobacteriota bacterium]